MLWRGLAELAQKYLHKGSLVYIEGRIRTRNWEDKDKNRRFSTEIVGDNLVMLDKRKEHTDGQTGEAPAAENGGGFPESFDVGGLGGPITKDDLPF